MNTYMTPFLSVIEISPDDYNAIEKYLALNSDEKTKVFTLRAGLNDVTYRRQIYDGDALLREFMVDLAYVNLPLMAYINQCTIDSLISEAVQRKINCSDLAISNAFADISDNYVYHRFVRGEQVGYALSMYVKFEFDTERAFNIIFYHDLFVGFDITAKDNPVVLTGDLNKQLTIIHGATQHSNSQTDVITGNHIDFGYHVFEDDGNILALELYNLIVHYVPNAKSIIYKNVVKLLPKTTIADIVDPTEDLYLNFYETVIIGEEDLEELQLTEDEVFEILAEEEDLDNYFNLVVQELPTESPQEEFSMNAIFDSLRGFYVDNGKLIQGQHVLKPWEEQLLIPYLKTLVEDKTSIEKLEDENTPDSYFFDQFIEYIAKVGVLNNNVVSN